MKFKPIWRLAFYKGSQPVLTFDSNRSLLDIFEDRFYNIQKLDWDSATILRLDVPKTGITEGHA